MTAPDARNDAVQFLYKHGEMTYSAAAAAIAKLCNNGFHITRVPLAEALAVLEYRGTPEQLINAMEEMCRRETRNQERAIIRAALRAIGEGRNE